MIARRHLNILFGLLMLLGAVACGLFAEAPAVVAEAPTPVSSRTPPPIPTDIPTRQPGVNPGEGVSSGGSTDGGDFFDGDDLVTATPSCTDIATVVQDVTVPPGTRLSPNQRFTKTWRVRNDGTCTWNSNYALVYYRRTQMNGVREQSLSEVVEPGQTVDLSVDLTAPDGLGEHWGEWMLRNPVGFEFGGGDDGYEPFFVSIEVAEATPTPTPTPTITPTPVPVIVEWEGQYFSTKNPTGNPTIVRNDSSINFNWGESAPDPVLPAEGFSAHWSRSVSFDTGLYEFTMTFDDGARFWIGPDEVFNDWNEGGLRTLTRQVYLTDGRYNLVMEYFDNVGHAEARLAWDDVPDDDFDDWRGRYWDNRGLSGGTLFQRNDKEINFDWGRGPVVLGMPDDLFSVRWTRQAAFDNDTYTFTVRSEGGVRVYVDNALIIDEWTDDGTDGNKVTANVNMTKGNHDIKVEYYNRSGSASISFSWDN